VQKTAEKSSHSTGNGKRGPNSTTSLPPEPPPHSEKRRPISFYLILAAVLLVTVEALPSLAPIILSFLLTLLIALAINPVVSRLRTWTGGRRGAAGLVVAATALIMALTVWGMFAPLKVAVTKVSEQLPGYMERLQKPFIKMEQHAARSEEKVRAEVNQEIAQTEPATNAPAPRQPPPPPPEPPKEPGTLRSGLNQTLLGVAGRFGTVAFNAAQIVLVLITVFFGVTFTLMNPRPVFGSLFWIVPERHHPKALTIMQRIGKFLPGWAGGTLLSMFFVGFLTFLAMWPIFGIMDAMVLGLIGAILEAIPFLGPVLAAVPAVLLALGKGGMTPLWVMLAYMAIQALENNLILPYVMAREMKLHPVAIFFSMLVCVSAFGVLGVLVAAPLIAIMDILHDELYRKRFLPTTTDADLDRLARKSLREKVSEDDAPAPTAAK
jgi:predicted PurR-regulated permease PerM